MPRKGSKRASAAKKKGSAPKPVEDVSSSSPEVEETEVRVESPQPNLVERLGSLSERLANLDERLRSAIKSRKETDEDPLLVCRPIGFIRSAYPEKTGTPRQGVLCPDVRAELRIEKDVFTNAGHSLEGLEGFSHVWLIFWFHLNGRSSIKAKVKPPRLEGKETKGVFATRSPHRPNPLGLSLVKLDEVVGDKLFITGVDLVDGTPVLDVKPFIGSYDAPVLSENEKVSPNWVQLADTYLPGVATVRFTPCALGKLKMYHNNCGHGCRYCLQHIDETQLHVAISELLKTDLRSRYRRDKCSDRVQIIVVDNLKVSVWYDVEGDAHVLNIEPREEGQAPQSTREAPEALPAAGTDRTSGDERMPVAQDRV